MRDALERGKQAVEGSDGRLYCALQWCKVQCGTSLGTSTSYGIDQLGEATDGLLDATRNLGRIERRSTSDFEISHQLVTSLVLLCDTTSQLLRFFIHGNGTLDFFPFSSAT